MAGLGAYIRARRESLGLTQAELAAKVPGLQRGTLAKVEDGTTRSLSPDRWAPMARALETPVVELLRAGGVNIPEDDPIPLNLRILWNSLSDQGRSALIRLGSGLLVDFPRWPETDQPQQ